MMNDFPDSSFLHIKPGGKKDSSGKTTPRSLRMFPVKDGSGKIDLPHLRNAIARIPQASIDAGLKKTLQARARSMLVKANANKEASFGDISNNLREAVGEISPAGQQRMMQMEQYPESWWVCDVYADFCVVETKQGCFKVAYTANADTGEVSLAARTDWKQVTQEWVEVKA